MLRAAASGLPRGATKTTGSDGSGDDDAFELIECAAMWCRPGATHQSLHTDFFRFVDEEEGGGIEGEGERGAYSDDDGDDDADNDATYYEHGGLVVVVVDDDDGEDGAAMELQLPPRVVAFVYLQDVPTVEHGATAFLPGV